MAPYNTRVPKPLNHQDFEERIAVLFKNLLNDPNIKRFGRNGQDQEGLDLLARRNSNARKVIGVQCKLKGDGERLTETEVRSHVKMAMAFRPKLTEYFLVTTAPDDTKLDKLAARLASAQKRKKRAVAIVVWGWNTLEARINESFEVKNTFDPGFSPATEKVQAQLDTIIEQQKTQAGSEQLARIEARLQRVPTDSGYRLPVEYANRELREQFNRVLKRRGFSEANWQKEICELADKAISGEFSTASNDIRADVVERAARAMAAPDTKREAGQYLDALHGLKSGRTFPIVDALLLDANGDESGAVQKLRQLSTPDSLSAATVVISRRKGYDAVFRWLEAEQIEPPQLSAPGVLNYLAKQIERNRSDEALKTIEQIDSQYFVECPCLHLIRGNLIVASVLPEDQKSHFLLAGLGINPRAYQLASDSSSRLRLRAARDDYEIILAQSDALGLQRLPEVVNELVLWLELEDASAANAARERLKNELSDPARTLQRIRLALAYGVNFNRDALQRQLRTRREVNGWTLDDRFAAFLLAFHQKDPAKIAAFFDEFGDELYNEEGLGHSILAAIEIEALARATRVDDAKKRLVDHATLLTPEQIDELTDVIAGIEGGDEAERARRRYEETNDLGLLRFLVGKAVEGQDHARLAEYGPILVRATRQASDFRLALQGLYAERQYHGVLQLCEEVPELYVLDDEFKSINAWSCFQVGKIGTASALSRELYGSRNESSDRELVINTSVESGDWGYLQSVMNKELSRIDQLDAPTLVRMSRLALEIGSPAVNQFRDSAVRRFPTNAEVFLSAYTLGLERGIEDSDHETHQFFEKAVALSGKDGPVQSITIREMLDKSKGWNDHVRHISELISENKIPIFLTAKGLRRQPIDLMVGQALRNKTYSEPNSQVPILSFAGNRQRGSLEGIKHIALDISALFTLDLLGILEKTISQFQQVIVAPTTLSNIFLERQFLKVHQPSQEKKAKRLVELIASQKIRILSRPSSAPKRLRLDIDDELDYLLGEAALNEAIVVRSGPVHKVGSLLEESVDLSEFNGVLSDTHAVFRYLDAAGRLDQATKRRAQTYLQHVDKGHGFNGPEIVSGSKLYLDELSVTYLDYVGLLVPLTKADVEVFVAEEVERRAQGIIKQAEFSADIIAAIERVRAAIQEGFNSGRIVGCARRHHEADEDEGDDYWSWHFPTLDLLSDLSQFDFVVVDDRFLNKDQNWTHDTRVVRTATSIDILITLRATKAITDDEYWQAMHLLREAGYSYVPVEQDELVRYVLSATVKDQSLAETPELRAIRENISLPKRADIYRPADESWFNHIRFSIVRSIRDLWMRPEPVNNVEARTNWLLSCLPNPLWWCHSPDDERLWAVAVEQTVAQYGILALLPDGDLERRARYGNWLNQRLFEPLAEKQPWLMTRIVEFVKRQVVRLMEVDDEET